MRLSSANPPAPVSVSSLSTGLASTAATPPATAHDSVPSSLDDVLVSGRSSPASQRGLAGDVSLQCSVNSRSALQPLETEIVIDVPDSPSKARSNVCGRWFGRCCQAYWTLPNIMKVAPILALLVTSTGLYFGIKNYLTLEASRATAILRTLGPVLRAAHADILAAVASIQRELGIPTMPPSNGTNPQQPGR